MSRINIPTAEQFDELNKNLVNIATALGLEIDTSTWAGVQKVLRVGAAPRLLPVGTQITVNHKVYGEMQYDVVAYDYFKSAKSPNSHTMTLMCHDLLPSMQIDSREAFYTNTSSNLMAPGTYNFTITTSYNSWKAGTYQFTTSQPIVPNGQLAIEGPPSSEITNSVVTLYSGPTSTDAMESVVITSGSGGTSLGTLGIELNTAGRCAYGSNNYKESAIRQFLNSTAEAGKVWTPQTKFDRPPAWAKTTAGFMAGLDDEFLSVVSNVIVPCVSNNTYESPDSTVAVGSKYTVQDKFYLASLREIVGGTDIALDDGSKLLPYYNGATSTDLIKYRDGAAYNWNLRTPNKDGASIIHRISNTGAVIQSGVQDTYGLAPMCTIV